MEGQEGNESTENGRKAEQQGENVVQFLDSMDTTILPFGFLVSNASPGGHTSTVQPKGWLELASARHSMGASRVNSALFDLKLHSAAQHCKWPNRMVNLLL
ncbi:hypothetical protein HHK36_008811 [Tetracentron sinense]|uniref:Vacuolar ATPase assembly protein VMA22 n=1 Tax=Tetracentron sinense TaxID=13715 RepID=A0A834ZG56_TETSI|nr:hypothetical protein HHK36_008811 [Tetracentron sinense]